MQIKPTDSSDHTSKALRPTKGSPLRPLILRDDARPGRGDKENVVSPAFLLWVFHQWWKVGIPVGAVLAVIVAALVIYLYVPRYEAKALLMIEDYSPYVAYSKSSASGQSRRYIQTQLELLRSAVVLEPVLSQPKIASIQALKQSPDPIEELRGSMSIKPLGGSELYDIGYISTVPEDAAAIVNAVVDEYLKYHLDDDTQRTQRVIDILEVERQRRRLEVDLLRKRLVNLSEEVTGKDPYSGSVSEFNISLNPIGSLFQSLTELDLERELLKAQKQFLSEAEVAAKDPLESSGLLKLEVDNHAETRQRQEAIASIESQMEAIKANAVQWNKNPNWETSPTYVALQKKLAQGQQDLSEFTKKLRTMILAQRKEQNKLSREHEIANVEQQLDVLNARSQILSKRFADQLNERKTGEGKSVELEFARAELAREEKVFELIASRKLALQTEMRAPARIQLTRKAAVPVIPMEPIPYTKLMMACSVALCVPFGMALLKEILVRRISDVDQLAQESRLRVLGEIAELPVRHVAISPGKMVGRVQRDAHVFAESVNSLRTNLTVAEDLHDKQIWAVMSPSSGESKSSVAVSLAMSIANATAKPTLIIDADMRSPDVASMLKTKSQPGLFEVLSGSCELEDVIQHVSDSSLYVIPAGRATRSTHHLVKTEELKKILDRLRTKFPMIVVDTPPILGASESIVLAKAADAVLFCSLSGVSKVKQLRMAIERLEHAGVNVAGAVLSGSSVKGYAYRYGYYPIENSAGV